MDDTMKAISHRGKAGRLVAYSTAATAVLAAASSARADGFRFLTNISVRLVNPEFSLDINGDGAVDAVFTWAMTSSTRYASAYGSNGGQVACENNNAKRFSAGETVSANAGEWSTFAPLFSFSLTSSTFTSGYFSHEHPGYVGVRFAVNGGAQTNYGWVHISSLSDDGTSYEITAYGYDDSGKGIRAGELPEPATGLAALAMGAAGMAALRRRT